MKKNVMETKMVWKTSMDFEREINAVIEEIEESDSRSYIFTRTADIRKLLDEIEESDFKGSMALSISFLYNAIADAFRGYRILCRSSEDAVRDAERMRKIYEAAVEIKMTLHWPSPEYYISEIKLDEGKGYITYPAFAEFVDEYDIVTETTDGKYFSVAERTNEYIEKEYAEYVNHCKESKVDERNILSHVKFLFRNFRDTFAWVRDNVDRFGDTDTK